MLVLKCRHSKWNVGILQVEVRAKCDLGKHAVNYLMTLYAMLYLYYAFFLFNLFNRIINNKQIRYIHKKTVKDSRFVF